MSGLATWIGRQLDPHGQTLDALGLDDWTEIAEILHSGTILDGVALSECSEPLTA